MVYKCFNLHCKFLFRQTVMEFLSSVFWSEISIHTSSLQTNDFLSSILTHPTAAAAAVTVHPPT